MGKPDCMKILIALVLLEAASHKQSGLQCLAIEGEWPARVPTAAAAFGHAGVPAPLLAATSARVFAFHRKVSFCQGHIGDKLSLD